MDRLLPIVFDDKNAPTYLLLAPCWIGNVADCQRQSWHHGTLTPPRIAPSRPSNQRTGVSLYPASASWQASAPHGVQALCRSLASLMEGHGGRSQVAIQKRKDPQHCLFNFQGAGKTHRVDSSYCNGQFLSKTWHGFRKNFLPFSEWMLRFCRHGKWKGQSQKHIPAGSFHRAYSVGTHLLLSVSVSGENPLQEFW